LRLTQGDDIFGVVAGHAPQETIHVEAVELARLLLVASGWLEVFAVRVEEASKTTHESGLHLIGMECRGTDDADLLAAARVGIQLTS
jgi:lactate dehydrogenase-like 2-hydroxyacid dehydrogenase